MQAPYTTCFMNAILTLHFRVTSMIFNWGVVCTATYGKMASSEHTSSSNFIKYKYVVLLLKIHRSKMAAPTNDASNRMMH